MNEWVDLIFAAIARQEGFFGEPHNLPIIRNNPLDLRYAGQVGASRPGGKAPSYGQPEPIAQFDTLAHGIIAGYRQIWADIARGCSLRSLISSWAPPKENNTTAYLQNVIVWTGISDADTPLLERLTVAPPETLRK